MTFIDAARSGIKNALDFRGRTSPSGFWYFVLFSILVSIAAAFIDLSVLGTQTTTTTGDGGVAFSASHKGFGFAALANLLLLVPSLSVAVRRLHDTDRRGWWIFIGLVPLIGWILLIVWYCQGGTQGNNRFGPPPA